MGKNASWRDPISTFWAGIFYTKKHFTLNIELLTSTKDWCLGLPKTKITRGKPNWIFFVFRLRSFHPHFWLRKNKKLQETQRKQKKQKNKDLGEMLCPRVSSTGLVFWFLCFFCFFGFRVFFCFFLSSLGRNVVPKGFLQGIVFFGFFVFFWFSSSFLGFETRKLSSATGLKKKKLEENQKKQRNQQKPKSWEKCCFRLRVFLVFDLWICVAFLRDNNQNQHILVLQ